MLQIWKRIKSKSFHRKTHRYNLPSRKVDIFSRETHFQRNLGQGDIESRKIVLGNGSTVKAQNTIVDWGAGDWVDICIGMPTKPTILLNNDNTFPKVLAQPDSWVSPSGSTSDDADCAQVSSEEGQTLIQNVGAASDSTTLLKYVRKLWVTWQKKSDCTYSLRISASRKLHLNREGMQRRSRFTSYNKM